MQTVDVPGIDDLCRSPRRVMLKSGGVLPSVGWHTNACITVAL